jgi:hypothetical protein
MPEVRLEERHARKAAIALEWALELCRTNRQPPDQDLCETAALLATAVPLTAVKLPLLLLAAGSQAAGAAKAEARRMAASRLGPSGVGSASSASATLTVREAARRAGVSCQAIRAAAATDGIVAARKNPITGVWQIPSAALEVWMEKRRAA